MGDTEITFSFHEEESKQRDEVEFSVPVPDVSVEKPNYRRSKRVSKKPETYMGSVHLPYSVVGEMMTTMGGSVHEDELAEIIDSECDSEYSLVNTEVDDDEWVEGESIGSDECDESVVWDSESVESDEEEYEVDTEED